MRQQLTAFFKSAIQAAFGELAADCDPTIQLAGRAEYGDYQANFAMRLAKQLQKKPIDIAQQVIDHITDKKIFKKLEASGPGFINIFLTNEFLEAKLQLLINDECLGVKPASDIKTIVVDYGGANVAKEMHVGHLRSAIIGDAIVRILSFLKHNVVRQNHLGDWGTQFGMLIEYMLESDQANKQHTLSDLNILYKQSKQRFDDDKNFADKARSKVVELQGGDEKTLAIWRQLVTESTYHFQKTYQRLDVLLAEKDICGESFYNDKLAGMVAELEQSGVAEINAGALVVCMEGYADPDGKPIPLLIRKGDGGYLYATTDLAAIKHRTEELHADWIIYVHDARQKQHFAMVFAAAQKAGWIKENIKLEHVPFGSILGEDRKPFKTRSGESVKLTALLDEAETRAAETARHKNPDLSDEQLAHIAKTVGIGALKYADLRNDKVKDYVFDWDKMLAFEGNTAPYLQNAYVRIRSIFRKGINKNIVLDKFGSLIELESNQTIQLLNFLNKDYSKRDKQSELTKNITLIITTDIEHNLSIKLLEFPEIIHSVGEDLAIQRLCDYEYDIASTFHKFYEHCPILSHENEQVRLSRLLLCDITARTLKLGLSLLGIDVLEMM